MGLQCVKRLAVPFLRWDAPAADHATGRRQRRLRVTISAESETQRHHGGRSIVANLSTPPNPMCRAFRLESRAALAQKLA